MLFLFFAFSVALARALDIIVIPNPNPSPNPNFNGCQGDTMRFREHRKLLSGRMSGRNRAEQLDGGDDAKASSLAAYSASGGGEGAAAAAAAEAEEVEAAAAAARKEAKNAVPPLREDAGLAEGEGGVEIEWWDDAFLTKEMRDEKVFSERFILFHDPRANGQNKRCIYSTALHRSSL